ncbi:hypothetical protein Q5H93_13235 [Hymenobacter sp. ASUV-10]|uniref:Uncharacterized protein n=1 Tax=Hymenobacter aranciens TaxID=3063996 RepID=A0ABT9BBY7_9BACT|nr:hypothetical protein [Hymenobacter sp. ASUV-10]MDO7875702.1 hypothetical protein [Hymenobacter sp. ASUV-10]
MQRAYYQAPIPNFLADDELFIIGQLVLSHDHALEDLQRNA